ncbi:DUF4032 domain-containing protein [Candidatus Chlorohelix sp.]|uniref:DUF4032 domain-containing protein n=1 Tax=Candidatus Chlorohelix sp. TaxID=3139201 RepID=UPI00305A8C1E
MPGDISADEVYADRELLNRLGYGIFDVQWGKSGVGFENVRDFSYVVREHEDPKLYRRKIFELVGKYYPNNLAKAVWDKFIDHKWVMSEQRGEEVSLKVAAEDWIENHSHEFLKEWTFKQLEVPYRIRSANEPRKDFLSVVTGRVFPNLQDLLNVGFSVSDIIWARLHEIKPIPKSQKVQEEAKASQGEGYYVLQKINPTEFNYIRLVANLTGHVIQTQEEAEKRWHEILEHKWYMSEREGNDVGLRTAALDYYRRLNLLAETERGSE